MLERIAEAWRTIDLRHTRQFDGVTARGPGTLGALKEAGWLTLATLIGLVGAVVAALIAALVMVFGIVSFIGGEIDDLADAATQLQAGGAPESFTVSMAMIALLAAVNGAAALALVALASLIRRQSLKRNFTPARKFRWGALGLGLVFYALVLGILLYIEAVTGIVDLEWPLLTLTNSAVGVVVFAVVSVVCFIIAAGAEELIFRGWLLRQTAAFGRNPIVLLLINGVLFSAIHLDPDPNAFIARTIMGIVFCYMAMRLGGIEFATGAHAANNILLSLFVEPISLTPPPPEPFNPAYLLESGLLLVVGIAMTEIVARVPALRQIAGVDEAIKPEPAEVFG